MRIRTIFELLRMTRAEVCGLLARIMVELPTFPVNSVEYSSAYASLQNIRKVLALRTTIDP